MKKAISFIILFSTLFFQCSFALEEIVQDEFALNSLDKNLKVEKVRFLPVADDFALNSLDKSLKIKFVPCPPIKDENIRYLDENLKVKTPDTNIAFFDDLNPRTLKVIPVKLYSTKNNLYEGDFIDFKLATDIKIGDIAYKKGAPVKARVETVMQNGIYGAPAEAVIDHFVLDNNIRLNGHLEKRGADRALWVYPCVYLLSWCFGTGLLFIPIRGGHVKFKPKIIYEIKI